MADTINDAFAADDFRILQCNGRVRNIWADMNGMTGSQNAHFPIQCQAKFSLEHYDDLFVRVGMRLRAFAAFNAKYSDLHLLAGNEATLRFRVLRCDEFIRKTIKNKDGHGASSMVRLVDQPVAGLLKGMLSLEPSSLCEDRFYQAPLGGSVKGRSSDLVADAADDILAGHDFTILNRLQSVRDVRRNMCALTTGQFGYVVTDRHPNSSPQDKDDLLVRVSMRPSTLPGFVLKNANFYVIACHEWPKRCRVLGCDEFLRDILKLIKAHESSFSLS